MMPHMKRLAVLAGLVACAASAPGAAVAQERVTGADGAVSLMLPAGFEEADLNPVAEIQYADPLASSYFIALLEDKDDFFGWNLTRHSMITLAQMLSVTDFPEVQGPVELTVGGYPAIQYELRGVSQGTQIVYLHTSVDTPTAFVQILAWSVRSRWNANRPVLRGIIESLEFSAPGEADSVSSEVFDVVPGTWAWESSEDGCETGSQTFAISDDRSAMTITHNDPYEMEDGTVVEVTNYVIEGYSPNTLHTFIPDETRLTDEGEPVKWDLVVVARDVMAWHRTDWDEGGMTQALIRCPWDEP